MHSITAIGEVVLIVTIFAGWFIYGSIRAVAEGFPPPSIDSGVALGLVLFECMTFVVAAAVLYLRGWRTQDFCFRLSWLTTLAGIILFGLTLPIQFAIYELIGKHIGGVDFIEDFGRSITLTPAMALITSIVNGAYEEFFLMRYLVERFATAGAAAAIGVSTLIRVMYHLYQGPYGAISVMGYGLAVSVFYWHYRQLWPVMLSHMVADFIALA